MNSPGSSPLPPILPSQQLAGEGQPETATLFVGHIYRGLDGVEPGAIKYLRVMEQIPKPWAAEIDPLRGQDRSADGFGGHIAVSHNAHIWIAVLLGIVPVEDDGSACLEVPSGKNLFFQLPGTGEVASAMKVDSFLEKPPTKKAKLREFLAAEGLKFKPSYHIITELANAPDPETESIRG